MKHMQFLISVAATGILTACNQYPSDPPFPSDGTREHSLASELRAFADLSTLPSWLDSTVCAQVSTYDTTGGNDDGFSGRYSYLYRAESGGLVLFDAAGPGVINRIWTPTPTADTLDFYIDDTTKPVLSVCYTDLFSGKVFPFVYPLCGNQLGGFYCYLPVPFQKSCRIISRGKLEQFHQIQYRLYKKGDTVRSFSPVPDDEAKELLERIISFFNRENLSAEDFFSGDLLTDSRQADLIAGKPELIFESRKGGRIAGIEISPPEALAGLNKDIDIRITWDDEEVPAVYCPAADFFGYSFGEPSMRSLVLGSTGSKAYCYIPMPYDKAARIELIRRKSGSADEKRISVSTKVIHSGQKRDNSREGKFYASWMKESPVPEGKPHVFARITGKGHYIGSILQAQGLKAGMTIFFEGDDSTAIDGRFRMHGTGSEDYFNGGWYAMMDRWDDRMSLPFHGSLGYSLPFCRTGGYRFFISDKMSFEKEFFHCIEHGPAGNRFPADYCSLGLYYCDTPPESQTIPSSELSGVFMPDTLYIYPQLTDFTIYGDLDIQTTWKYGTGGESYLLKPGKESWLRMSLDEIPEGDYHIFLDVIRSAAGCDISLWQRQKMVSGWIPTFSQQEKRDEYLPVCDVRIPGSNKTLTIRFRQEGNKNSLLLNRVVLIRKI